MADTRYNGPLDGLDLSDLTGGPAPSNSQPAPQQPVPPAPPTPQQSTQSGSQSENDNDDRRRGWGKWVITVVIAAAIALAVWLWVIPAAQARLDTNPSSGSDSSQSGNPTSTQDPAPGNSQSGGDDGDQSGSQTSTTLSVAEQAALLDPWFDVPEKNWETKTTAELGVDPTTPLGSFAKNFCVVLSDGTVIARGTSETGDSIPTIISDYTVPSEWNGTAVVIAENDFNTVLIVSKLPENTNQELYGAIWHFEAAEGTYVYSGKGHTTPPATE